MNITTLSHPKVQARLFAAMRLAVNAANGFYSHHQKGAFQISPDTQNSRGTVYIQNRNGNNFIRVDYHKAQKRLNGGVSTYQKSGFTFYNGNGDCTALVLASLKQA